MKTFDEMDYHPDAEKLVEILCNKTQNTNPLFFRVMAAYYFSLIASMMRCKIKTRDRGEIPVNCYAINLATSGFGKGHSTNVVEEEVIDQFQHNFTDITLQQAAEKNLPLLAHTRSVRNSTDPDEELAKALLEFDAVGPLYFSFDSGTAPAIKDIRHKLLMAEAGALNLQIDEIGLNLTGNLEILAPYLELYDVGKVKQKMTKNGPENKRREEIIGRTPANMVLYGTPNRLLNGGKTEDEFYALLDSGYARRCFFGFAKGHSVQLGLTAAEVLAQRTCNATDTFLEDMSDKLGDLADFVNMGRVLQLSEPVQLLFIEYEIRCQVKASQMREHDEMRKAELTHRYFKALKLAGAYAFIDGCPEITEDHAYNAIKLAEDSGKAFDMLLTRDRAHVKLAKYIADVACPITQADLVEDLPFYRGAIGAKNEMMQLAIAYGYQNNIVIKKSFQDGVEFLRGETLVETNLDEIRVSYSNDLATGYVEDTAKFTDLHKMTQAKGVHWCNHSFRDGHRQEENAIPGFNIIVLDIDGGINLSTAKMLLAEYKAMFYTTKRHTPKENRFRIVLPISYTLELDASDHKAFWENIYTWLPFEVDHASSQRARKWLSHPGHYEYQDGEILDILPFIPKTTKEATYQKRVLDQQGMDNLDRWVVNNTGDGNRNKMLLRYAMILVDADLDFNAILGRVNNLNDMLPDKLDEAEILSTIMVTVAKVQARKQP